MEPNRTSTVSDLHDEGVDIMGDSGADNEGSAQVPNPPENPTEPAQEKAAPVLPTPESPAPAKAPEAQPTISRAQHEINQTLGTISGSDAAPGATNAQSQTEGVHNDPSIKSIRTFKSDAEEAIRYKNVSAAQISLAEQNKRLAREQSSTLIEREEPKKSSTALLIMLGICGICIAGGAYYWLSVRENNPALALPQELRVESILPYTKAETAELSNQENAILTLAQALQKGQVGDRGIYAVIPIPQGTTTIMATTDQILKDTKAPSMLKRSLSNRYMIGTYEDGATYPFIIFKNTYFQNAFAGMLEWEKNLKADLITLIRISNPEESSTLENTIPFEDNVISNIDTRVLKNAEGTIILAYAFSDKDTIVVTTSTDALKALLDKLLAVRVVQ
jgi:hypothetical protein